MQLFTGKGSKLSRNFQAVSASTLELECLEEARFCARVQDSRDLILPDCMSREGDTICIKEGEHNNCGSLLKTDDANHLYQNELSDLEGNSVTWKCAYFTPPTCSINPADCPFEKSRTRREGVLDEPTTMISIGPIDVSDALLIDGTVEEIIHEIEGEIGEQDERIKIHPTVLWSLVSALIVIFIAIIALFFAVLRWMRQNPTDKYSINGSSVMLQNSPRGSMTSVETVSA
ncbi:Oidioi.mRNA.OKI2018_I69.chr1.g66.t1.cds [Oikopleura dioica]|uniref:Oidioi.mRNA.OKI2018_I69.chr1.g66.t1.cds n=1 Tax=Oikopleura dioica TaxID=34765 RepID=A0ABN7SN83_OIKDI|nr:Oidioi.mRNA.OKI2018_I69.chr1.g66.t1.cds [Oikopleura dioica]